jgi:hypothetical protein
MAIHKNPSIMPGSQPQAAGQRPPPMPMRPINGMTAMVRGQPSLIPQPSLQPTGMTMGNYNPPPNMLHPNSGQMT